MAGAAKGVSAKAAGASGFLRFLAKDRQENPPPIRS